MGQLALLPGITGQSPVQQKALPTGPVVAFQQGWAEAMQARVVVVEVVTVEVEVVVVEVVVVDVVDVEVVVEVEVVVVPQTPLTHPLGEAQIPAYSLAASIPHFAPKPNP